MRAEHLLQPTNVLAYLNLHYSIIISLASFYSMISRGQAPKVTYFRGRPRFTIADIDEWVQRNISDKRK
jgi:predicted DNA-binding transcriptional regulator AlpA